MSKIKKSFITLLAVIMCALLAVAGSLLYKPKKAEAINASTVLSDIVEINVDGGINRDRLNDLYKRLNNNQSATYDTIKNRVSGTAITATSLASQGEFDVTFGGMRWAPVYLSQTTGGDVILTLWLSEIYSSTDKVQYSYFSSTSNGTYPSSMYSSSMIRSYLTGSYYATNLNSCTSKYSSSPFQAFANTYGKYIATPSQVTWQLNESVTTGLVGRPGSTYAGQPWTENFANEAASSANIPNSGRWDGNRNPIFTGSKYFDWADDKIWTPSMTETGSLLPHLTSTGLNWYGLWRCTDNQLKTTADFVLLRTEGGYNHTFYLTGAGAYNTTGDLTYKCPVRPAFHLNLTELEKVAKYYVAQPSGTTQKLAYTGSNRTYTLPNTANVTYSLTQDLNDAGEKDASLNGLTFNATNVGTYKVTAKPSAGAVWSDGTTAPVEYTISITPADIVVNFQTSSLNEEDKRARNYAYNLSEADKVYPLTLKSSLISTTANQPVTAKYVVDTLSSAKPDENDVRWNAVSPEVAGSPGDYKVWFKLTAPNHNVCIDYFTVKISPQIISLTSSASKPLCEPITYGHAKFTQKEMFEMFKSSVTKSVSESEINNIDVSEIEFYLYYEDVDGAKHKLNMNVTDSDYWDAGTYYFDLQYTDVTNSHFVEFSWTDKTRPQITINPLTVNLTWIGKDGNPANQDPSNFSWEYDGNPHAPTASFIGLTGEQKIVADGEINANTHSQSYEASVSVKNYVFSEETRTCEYYITQGTNSWITRYRRAGWALDKTPTTERAPQPKWGADSVEIKYYVDEQMTSRVTIFNEARTYYVKIVVPETDNWAELVDTYQFTVYPAGTIVPDDDYYNPDDPGNDNPGGEDNPGGDDNNDPNNPDDPNGGGTTTPGGDDNNDPNNPNNPDNPNGGGTTNPGDEAGKVPGDNLVGGSGSLSELLHNNWWWLLILLVLMMLFMLLIVIIIIISGRRREERAEERNRQMMEMFMSSQHQQNYPMYQVAEPMAQLPNQVDMPQLQLPSAMSEESMKRAFVAAMLEVNAMQMPQAQQFDSDGFDDIEGFYDDITPDDINGLFNK